MRNLIPQFVLDKTRAKELGGSLEASVLSVDLRGFTALTQDLMQQSESGAEVLCDVINAIFSPAIEAIESRGGFISGFAGDAFTAIFPMAEDAGLALGAALAIRDFFIARGIQKTEFGDYEICVKLGLAKGTVQWTIIPEREQSVYWFSGEGIGLAVQAQDMADSNQLVYEHRAASNLDQKAFKSSKLDSKFSILDLSDLPDTITPPKALKLSQKAFVPPQILELKQEGEFREVLSCFINLSDAQDWQVKAINSLSAKYGAYFNKVDCTDKGWVALLLFGAPIAYEKTGLRAVQFAHDLRNQIGKSIRIGLSRGKAYAGFIGSRSRGEYTALGMAVNLGARFMCEAAWGEIWLDLPILRETTQNISSEDLGALQFKGFDKPIPAYKLTGMNASTAALYQTTFVGRAQELKRLLGSCAPLFERKFAGVSYIYGEAGQGKSRLVYELQKALGDKVQFFYLQCDSILRGALNPFIYWIRQQFTTAETGSTEERRIDFRERWAELVAEQKTRPETDEIVTELHRIESVIAGLIGLEWEGSIFANLTPKERQSATQFALKSLVETYCLLKPVVLVLEDLHWIDSETNTVLQVISRKAMNTPFKLIVTSRYHDDQSKPVLSLDADLKTDSIDLNAWDQETMQEYAREILQAPPDQQLARNLYARAQGNPFFTEQICLYLLETEQLVHRDGLYCQKESELSLPLSINALLVARLDRLEVELKRTVQTASVLGSQFAINILQELLIQLKSKAGKTEILQEQITTGEQERIWNALGNISYIFSHSMLRDSAYQMQLKKNLRMLHLIAAQAMEKLAPDDKTQYAEIATHYDNAGNWQKAVELYNKAGNYEKDLLHFDASIQDYSSGLTLNQKHRGKRHPDTASSLYYIGVAYYTKCEYDKALQYHEQGLSIRQELLGEKHVDTAKSVNSIGTIYADKGEFDKALQYYERALSTQQEALGKKHSDTAHTLNNMGGTYYKKGKFDTALQCHEQALSIRKEILGERHQDTASSLNNIGSLYQNKGEYDKALQYHLQTLSIWQETLGERHPFTALSLMNIGLVYTDKGEYDKGLEHYEQALSIALEVFGERHTTTASILNNMGNVCLKKSEDDRGLQCYERALAIWQEVLGERHPYAAISLQNIGIVYVNKGEIEQGLQYLERALPILQEILGEKHPETARIINNIGAINSRGGDFDKALQYYDKALAIRLEALGEKHPDIAESYNNIGAAYDNKGECDKALEYYERSLSVSQEVFGERHPDDASCLNSIGIIYLNKDEFDKARQYFEQSLSIWQEALGEGHIETAASINNIGVVYDNKGEYDKAIQYFERALAIRQEALGEKHLDIAHNLNNIGNVYLSKGDYPKALQYFEQTLSIRQELLEEGHPDTLTTISSLAETYEKMAIPEKAAEYRALAEQKTRKP